MTEMRSTDSRESGEARSSGRRSLVTRILVFVAVAVAATVPSVGELADRGLGGILSPRVIIAFVILGLFPITVKKIIAYVRSRRETAEELVEG